MPEVLDTYDYLIVGAGPAGCLLANRLSADPANRVLLLEAGGPDNYPWIHIPVGYLYCIGNPRTDWCFDTDEVPGLNGRSLKYPRGKVLGGCSSINGMIYMRGQARDYDQWVAEGNPGWSWRELLPLFRRMEDHFAGTSEMHGAGGEWRVERQRLSRSCSMPSSRRRRRPASPASRISTVATTKAAATSRSTSAAGCAGMPLKASCAASPSAPT